MGEENRKYLKEEDYVELNSLDAAHRFADEQQRNFKEENKREMANADAIAVMMPKDKLTYLKYGMNLLLEQRRCSDKERIYMELFIYGCSDRVIADSIGVPRIEVKNFGQEVLRRVQDAIKKAKSARIPILGRR